MAPTLVALFGPKRGVRIELEGPMLVGRSSSAELQLIDGKVSREHCRLLLEEGQVVLKDLGSQNGTFVNGERVRGRRVLARGDELAIGDSLFLLDPDLAVMAARFGDATLVVSSAEPAGVTRPAAPAAAAGDRDRDGALPAVRALASALSAAPGLEAGLEALLSAIERSLGAGRAFVLAGDGEGATLRTLAGRTAGGARDRSAATAAIAATPVVPRATLAAAAKQRRAVTLDGPVEDRSQGERRSTVASAARSVLVVPVVAGDVVKGFLYLDRPRGADGEGAYSPDEVALVEAMAALVALHGLGGVMVAPAVAAGAGGRPAPSGAAGSAPVGTSPAFARVLKLAEAAARATSTVLITGESGTGKEEIARYIHRASGRGPFVAVNCGAIPEALAEAELFGHERGAFTGAVGTREGRVESADGGTLLLDEIGELPPALQVKLLRVLQERVFTRIGGVAPRSVDLRVIAATHRRPEVEVRAGRFREDLYYRLNVLRIEIPPLRDRRADIAPLATAMLARIALALGRGDPGLGPGAIAVLERAAWPGNARELGNVLERALVLREPDARGPLDGDEIRGALAGPEPLSEPAPVEEAAPPARAPAARDGSLPLPDKVAALERMEIVAALHEARGVKARAAKRLGISRPTLDKKIADLRIDLWGDDRTVDRDDDDDDDDGEREAPP